METKQKIIIVGGGFAGLQFARHLDPKYFEAILIDQVNHHQFQPLFYQVASARIEPSSISFPFRKIFQHKDHVQIRLAKVQEVDAEKKIVKTTIGDFNYDILVLATGCVTNYFGLKLPESGVYSLKTTYEAIQIRNNIIRNFENIVAKGADAPEELYNIVIVGAGPTGVEMAGAFAEMKKNILPKDYPRINYSKVRIILVEGSKTTLTAMSTTAQKASLKFLRQLGVEVRLGIFVKEFENNIVTLSDGEQLKTKNLIWTGGIKGNLIGGLEKGTIERNNRIVVDRFNKIEGYDDIYAIGDIALMKTLKYPNGHPQVANVAINQGKMLAKNLKRVQTGKTQEEYEYEDRGSMATVGKFKAVVDLPYLKFKGLVAWFAWMFLHLMLILSVRNRLIIFINWVWSFFTNDTSLRLILSEEKKNDSSVPGKIESTINKPKLHLIHS